MSIRSGDFVKNCFEADAKAWLFAVRVIEGIKEPVELLRAIEDVLARRLSWHFSRSAYR